MMDVEANETDPSCESRVLFWIVTRAFHVCDSRFCDFGKSKLVTAAPHGCRVQDSRFHQTRPRSRLTPHASLFDALARLCVCMPLTIVNLSTIITRSSCPTPAIQHRNICNHVLNYPAYLSSARFFLYLQQR